jgi:hypothetical protein
MAHYTRARAAGNLPRDLGASTNLSIELELWTSGLIPLVFTKEVDMRWRLGSVIFGALLVSLAMSPPASGACGCNQQYFSCMSGCNSYGPCEDNCLYGREICVCACGGICP